MTTPPPSSASTSRRSEFSSGGWIVLALAGFTAALTGPGQTIGVSVFIDHFVSDLDLSRSQVSGAYLIGTLAGATALPVVGRTIDARGVRVMQVAVGACFALALANMSFVNGLIWLAVGFAGIRFLGQGSLSLVANITVALAFTRQRGLAIGIFATLSAALMALVPVALNAGISVVGWRDTWLWAGGFVAATVIPIGWFGLRSLPVGSHAAAKANPVNTDSLTRRQAVHTRTFWILASISATTALVATALNFHQVDLASDAGISSTGAAALFLPQVVGSTLAGLAIGGLADRLGTRWLPAAAMLLLVTALLLAAGIGPGITAVAYAITLGAASGAARTTVATALPNRFGTAHLGSIQGLVTLISVGASAVGPVALSITQGGFNSYGRATILFAGATLGVVMFALSNEPSAN